MRCYAVKIPMTNRLFSFDLFGPGFSSIYPWERSRRKIYKHVKKEKRKFSK